MYGELTDKEKSLVYLIGKGMKNTEIAENLGLTPSTVAVYIYHLSKQYNAKNRIELFNILKGRI